MKKLFILAAFLGFGYVGAQAQNATPAKPAPATVQPAQQKAEVAPVVNVDLTDDAEAKTAEAKKKGASCSSEQKSCGKASAKKACCSSKKQATTTTAPNQ
ncbi:MAG: hypothetical protein EAY81_06190 [Bacteroidetes bacterium]|nr:MAG: hypothetical protein EAY81_06190 [Bacteroidota bacterium]